MSAQLTSLAALLHRPSTSLLLQRKNSSAAPATPWLGRAPSGPLLTAALAAAELEPRQLSTAAASGAAWHAGRSGSAMLQQGCAAGYTPLASNSSFAAAVPFATGPVLTAGPEVAAASPFAAASAQQAPLALSSGSSDSDEDAFGLPKRAAQWPMRRALRRCSAGPAALDKMRNAARSRLLGSLRDRSAGSLARGGGPCCTLEPGAARADTGLAPAAAGLDILQDLDVCAAVEHFRAAVA